MHTVTEPTLDQLRILKTDGYDAVVEAYAIHPTTREICLLSLVGEPDAIKALKASMSIGLRFSITGISSCTWPKEATTFFAMTQKRLPSGAQAVLWLPHHGTSVGVQHDTRAFIIDRTPHQTEMPPNFVYVLDRVLACPIRPEWGPQLWETAITRKWVSALKTYNCTVWEFTPKADDIIAWIHERLRTRQLTIPEPPSPAATERQL